MPEQTPAPTPPAPAAPATPPVVPAAPAAPVGAPPAADKRPPWGKPENFDADKAWELIENLRKEKGTDPALKTELDALRTAQESQRAALAAALGVTPETVSDEAKLAERVEALQGQILTSEKRALAVEFKVPVEMLTAPDAEALRAQAAALAEFAQAAHYAAVAGTPPAATPPPFQQNPGQGQGGGPLTPEAQVAAEYEKYYPSTTP